MKKSTKLSLITSGVLFILGIGMIIIAGVYGFGFSQFRQATHLGIFRFGEEETQLVVEGNADGSSSGTNTQSGKWLADEIRNLDVEFSFGLLEITTFEGDEIEVAVKTEGKLTKYADEIVCKQDGDTLKIQSDVKHKVWSMFSSGTDDVVLTIQIPADKKFDKVELEIGAGEMKVSGMQSRQLIIECGAGEVELQKILAEQSDIECGAGEIKMGLLGEPEEYSYSVECGIGEVTVGEKSYSGFGTHQQMKEDGSNYLDIECGVGEIQIFFDEE